MPFRPDQALLKPDVPFVRGTDFMEEEDIDNAPPILSATDSAGNNYPLHPIMQTAYNTFRTRNQRQALTQPIYLASRILNSGVLHPFFHIFTRRPRPWQHGRNRGRYFEQCNFDRPLNAAERQEVNDLLNLLAQNLTWRVHAKDSGGAYTTGTNHALAGLPHAGGQYALPSQFGRQSIIELSSRVIGTLSRAHLATNTDHAVTLIKNFETAIAILHEIGHAFNLMMLATSSEYIPFFGSHTFVAEVGFELEKYLLGGNLTRLYHERLDQDVYFCNDESSSYKNPLVVSEWPNPALVEMYQAKDSAIEVRADMKRYRPLQNAWRVDLDYVLDLFRDETWAPGGGKFGRYTPRLSRTRFLMEKNIGYTFKASTRRSGCVLPVKGIRAPGNVRRARPAAVVERMYVPRGYSRMSSGDLRPVQGTTAGMKKRLRYAADGSEGHRLVFE